MRANNFPVENKYFVAFKGKRYLHGIGSDTRNSLHHLHNNRDVVMVSQSRSLVSRIKTITSKKKVYLLLPFQVTTCKHGKNWRELADERCEEDNAEYDR